MGCAQINILGGGSASPPTVSFPGAYSGSDPGVKISIYYPPITNYIIPGPRPFTCGGQQTTQPTTQPTTSTTTTTTTTTTTPTTTPTTSSTTTSVQPTSSGTVEQYGQCGGSYYTGPTDCVPPYRCLKHNDFVSVALIIPSLQQTDWVPSRSSTLNAFKLFDAVKTHRANVLPVGTAARHFDLFTQLPERTKWSMKVRVYIVN